MFSSGWAQSFNLVEIKDNQVCKPRKVEGIKWLIVSDTRKVAKSKSFEFKLAPFLSGRQIAGQHRLSIAN